MLEFLKNLSLPVKIAAAIVILLLGIWIFDLSTGKVREWKNDWFDSKQAQVEKQNEELLAENIRLRTEAEAAVKNAEKLQLEVTAKDVALEELNARSKAELDKLDKALKHQDKVEAETAQPTDAYTRCVRFKQKALELGSTTAKEIDCESKKQN